MADTKKLIQRITPSAPTFGTRIKEAIVTIKKAGNGKKDKVHGPEAPR